MDNNPRELGQAMLMLFSDRGATFGEAADAMVALIGFTLLESSMTDADRRLTIKRISDTLTDTIENGQEWTDPTPFYLN